MMKRSGWVRTTLLTVALAMGPALAAWAAAAFTPTEREKIVALGPWPQAPGVDPSNVASGKADAIELGRRLFFDARLSPVGYISCVTCHQPDRAWTDHRQRAHGLADVDRNTQALNNQSLQQWFGWGGTSDSLWMASIRPILDARELDSNAAHVRQVYVRVPEYACLFRRTFDLDPVSPEATDEAVLVFSAKAIAAFTETLTTQKTAFDGFRDALANADADAIAAYPAPARRGLGLFVGKGHCVACHSGPNFSDQAFHNTTVPWFEGQRKPDMGRWEGLRYLKASPFSLLGRYNDDVSVGPASARRWLSSSNIAGAFRTPSLRNVAHTAPYMHNGALETLADVIDHYSNLDLSQLRGQARVQLQGLALTPDESADLIAFLETLSDPRGENRGLPTPRTTACD